MRPSAGLTARGGAPIAAQRVCPQTNADARGFERVLAADANGRTAAAVAAGLLFGLAILTRETLLYFAPLVGLWLAWRRPVSWRLAAAFVLGCVVTVAPWTVRNYLVFGSFVPVATRGSLMLLLANTDRPWEDVYAEYGRLGPVEGPRKAFAEAIREAAGHPRAWYPRKVWREMAAFWGANILSVIHLQYEAYGPLHPWTNRLVRVPGRCLSRRNRLRMRGSCATG